MELRREIKGSAKRALAGRFGPAIITLFVVALVLGLFGLLEEAVYEFFSLSGIEDQVLYAAAFGPLTLRVSQLSLLTTGAAALFGFVVMVPLLIGVLGWYLRLASGEADNIISIFRFFSSARMLWRAWSLTLMILVRSLFWQVLFCLPGVSVLLLSSNLLSGTVDSMDTVTSVFGAALGVSMTLALSLCAAVFCMRYLLAPFLLAESPSGRAGVCIRRSVSAMRGYYGHAFVFFLSFLPWALLCVLVLPLLYALPYFLCCCALYAKYLMERAFSPADPG